MRWHTMPRTDKKLSNRRGTARRSTLVNSRYVIRAMGFKQHKWPSRSFKGIGNGNVRQATYDFLYKKNLHFNYVSILHRFW